MNTSRPFGSSLIMKMLILHWVPILENIQRISFSSFFIIFFLFLGCENSELEKSKLDLIKAKEIIKIIESDRQKLSSMIDSTQRENKLVSKRIEFLEARVMNLFAGYGQGIWNATQIDNPVFVRSTNFNSIVEFIWELNKEFEKDSAPKIIFKKVNNRVVHVGIDNESQLTQRMGSFGAGDYLMSAFYSISSFENIDCVFFDFTEGDHAEPGTYCLNNVLPY